MRKTGLRDIKRRNRQLILETILENEGLSRVEIAQKTGLAASTVSTLTGELLSEGLLIEAGTVVTAGRSRTELTINPDHGSIVVVEIGRREICATCFNMALLPVRTETLSARYMSSNELLMLIHKYICSLRDLPPVCGIGLLFQEDMRESDFHVMYSTGHDAANITLQDALKTQYRVPVEAQYSVAYTVTDALTQESNLELRNSAHIAVGAHVAASVTLNGKPVPIRQSFCEDLAQALQISEPAPQENSRSGILQYLEELIVLLCILFPVETVFFSGTELLPEEAEEYLHGHALVRIHGCKRPKLKFLKPVPAGSRCAAIAGQVLKKSLAAL